MAEVSKEAYGSKTAVLPMMTMISNSNFYKHSFKSIKLTILSPNENRFTAIFHLADLPYEVRTSSL
jgi:hypothetical protein